ncbi:hypothetical protein B0A52_02370 [Exophiala mesophila]|uniref:EKC/KEOPS complex subunit GON7 n=1 Tax=Exophiala mesophila TaxID=212818 RepID=A0A438NBT9_EXOME|nr:hypothetical protein B0A52_02370 [Exophiala mesophila]
MAHAIDKAQASLIAAYSSPNETKQFEHLVPSPKVSSDGTLDTTAKTQYLSQLRASTKKLQEDINTYLTQKMEEDKRAGADTVQGKTADEVEEENYGEAPAGEDDDAAT